MVENIEPMSDKAKNMLVKMMEHTEEAYFQVAQAAEQFTQLARECSTPQLMTVMKYAVRPIIQIEGAIERSKKTTGKRKDLPEEIAARVNLTLLPNVIFLDWVGEIHTAQLQRLNWRQRTRIPKVLL